MWIEKRSVRKSEWTRGVSAYVACLLGILFSAAAVTAQEDSQPPRRTRAELPPPGHDAESAQPGQDRQPLEGQHQPDRLDAFLESLDPQMLNLSGAELDYEVVGDKLIMRGNARDLDLIQLLVRYLEGEIEQKDPSLIGK